MAANAACQGGAQNGGAVSIPETPTSILARVVPDDCHGPTAGDFAAVQSALAALQRAGDIAGQIRALTLLATLEQETGDANASLPYAQTGLALAQQSGDRMAQVRLLALAGVALKETDWQAAEKDLKESSDLAGKGDAGAQAFALTYQAEIEANSDPKQAMTDLQQALHLAESAKDLKTKAIILNDEAEIYSVNPASADEAASMFETASNFADGIHDCHEKAANLSNWADFNVDAGHESEAFQQYQQALAIDREAGDKSMEAPMLHALAYFYEEMGDLDAALANFRQSLAMEQKLNDVREEGPTMAAIAGLERDAAQPAAALDDYRLALPVLEKANDVGWEIIALNNMGACEADLHQAAAARDDYTRSAAAAAKTGNLATSAYSAWGLGELEEGDALAQYFSALRLAREYSQSDLEGMVDASLMDHFRLEKMPAVAIFFGKRAVDRFQSIRRQMGGLADAIVSSYLQKKASAYRELAELLLEQGRLVEAQQVLDLLKIQQYADYVRKEPGSLGTTLARTPAEQTLETRYDQLFSAVVAADGAVRTAQGAAGAGSPAAAAAAQKAQQQAVDNLNGFVLQIEKAPAAPVADIPLTGAELSLQKLIAAQPGTVALYTLLGQDGLRILVITAKGRVVRIGTTPPSVIDEDCTKFLDQLNKGEDSTATAAALYAAIVGPVQNDLSGAQAKTVVWSLDGALRYIPVAALYNAKTASYLIDRYTVVNFTPLGRALEDVPRMAGATGIAMGVTEQYEADLPPLPSVTQEVDSVVTDRAVNASHGVLPGTILLNPEFTREAMEQKVKAQAVIHIASHFVLVPGNDQLSYLLLGGDTDDHSGYHFPMSDLASDMKIDIAGTKLMTLSACQTGAENKRPVDGVVMESLGELALDRGAEAAISSLWDVTDESTGDLMGEFYRLWVKGKMSKASALHQAELDLLHGKIQPSPELKSRGIADFSNPHFWAPFVLAGNWQ